MVLHAGVLHDGLDAADPSVCLLSVPFDQVEGYRCPAVTPATGVGSVATPWTVQQIHITTYIVKSEFWYISDDVQLVKKNNLQADCAGLSRPIRKQRSVAPMMTPLGLMLTVKNQKILNTHPRHTVYIRVLFFCCCCFFLSHHYLWLQNWGQEAHGCITPTPQLQSLQFDQKSSLRWATSWHPTFLFVGMRWELCHGTSARLHEAVIVSLGSHLYLYAIWVNNHAVKLFI